MQTLIQQPTQTMKSSPIDRMTLHHQGVVVHVYGILGLTGGPDQTYIRAVNETIAAAEGLRLGQVSIAWMYKGLHGDLADWLQVPLADAFRLAFALTCSPVRLLRLLVTGLRRKTTQPDKYAHNARRENIGGSLALHSLSPYQRRNLAGFPDPETYLRMNLDRRAGMRYASPSADPDWLLLSYIEPYSNIPCRSIHMLEYGVTQARAGGFSVVSLFVGEIHNTDMAWLTATVARPLALTHAIDDIRIVARRAAIYPRRWRRRAYVCSLAAGALAGIAPYGLLLALLLLCLTRALHY